MKVVSIDSVDATFALDGLKHDSTNVGRNGLGKCVEVVEVSVFEALHQGIEAVMQFGLA